MAGNYTSSTCTGKVSFKMNIYEYLSDKLLAFLKIASKPPVHGLTCFTIAKNSQGSYFKRAGPAGFLCNLQ
jgi:hypothetical protein